MEIVCPARFTSADKLTGAVPLLADQGVTAIEILLGQPEYFDQHDADELEELLTALASSGVRVHSVHSPFGPAYDISSPDDSVHERGVDTLIESIEMANLLDAGIVVVHAGDRLTNDRRRRIERARGVLRELGVIARESQVLIALENLPPGYLGDSPDEIASLIAGTDAVVCFDSGHANLSGMFEAYAAALLPFAAIMHLHDNKGGADEHLFPGEGTIDWRRLGAVYRMSRCKAAAMLECPPPEGIPWSEAFQRLRRMLEG